MNSNDYDENNNNYEQEEDFENDIYLIELHKRFTQMKKDRKKAENDAQLLNNRLRLLKTEEDKVIQINQDLEKDRSNQKETR